MFCTNCGAKMTEQNKFCIECGQLLEKTAQEPVPAPVVSQDPPVPSVSPALIPEAASAAYEVHPDTAVNKIKSKWLYVGSAVLLLILLGGGSFYLLKSHANKVQPQAAATSTVSPLPSTIPSPTGGGIDHLNVSLVDLSHYPDIKLVVDVGATNGLVLSAKDFSVTENSIVQPVKSFEPMDGNKMAITYVTKVFNNTPGNADKRAVELKTLDKKAVSSYDAPQQQVLSIGDVSYNTDQYPNIKLYFSLYDSNQGLIESTPSEVSFFNLNENNQPIQVSEVAKMSDLKESLSTNVVIDISNSMSDKIDRVKQIALQFLNQSNVTPNDRIGLMGFAGATEITQNSFTNDKSSVSAQISTLAATGKCTALYRALEEAVYNTAYNGVNGSKYVVLFTDGGENCSNEGIANQDTVNPQTVINSAIQLGVPIYAVGVDRDDQLQHIAKETNGQYISIGSDIQQLGQFYQSIYTKKKGQYVVTYTSGIPEKSPRNTNIIVNAPFYYSKLQVSVTPRLVDDSAVVKTMELYQINWSAAMSSGDMSYLTPYVVVNSSSPTSVYNLMSQQVKGVNEAKQSGNYSSFDIPIYQMLDAKKVSATQYQLRVKKHFKRTVRVNNNVTGDIFKETAYTYNIVKQNGKWLVDSTVESQVPEICYTDQTFSQTKGCEQ